MILKKGQNKLIVVGLNQFEFDCKCGKCKATIVTDKFSNAYHDFRVKTGEPIYLTSGYRCQHHNSRIGGAELSQHILGNAADFVLDKLLKIYGSTEILQMAMRLSGFTYVYFNEEKNFVHGDVR